MRTKPKAPEKKSPEENSIEHELAFNGIKEKNLELVKRVTKLEQQIRELNQDRFLLQRQYVDLKTQTCCAQKAIPEIKEIMKSCTPMFITIMEKIMKVIDLCNGKEIKSNTPVKRKDFKTQAVKPHTVNGTVILNPRISLKRLSDVTLNQLNSSSSEENQDVSSNKSRTEPLSTIIRQSLLEVTRTSDIGDRPSTSSGRGSNRHSNNVSWTDEVEKMEIQSRRSRRNLAAEEPGPGADNLEYEEEQSEDISPEELLETILENRLSVILEENSISPNTENWRSRAERTSSIEAEPDEHTFQGIDSFMETSVRGNVLRNRPVGANDSLLTPRVFSPHTNSTRVEHSLSAADTTSRVRYLPSNFLDSFKHSESAGNISDDNSLPKSKNVTPDTTPTSGGDIDNVIMKTPSASDLGDKEDDTISKHSLLYELGLEPSIIQSRRSTPKSSPRTRLGRKSKNLYDQHFGKNSVQKENETPNIVSGAILNKELIVVLHRTSNEPIVTKVKNKKGRKSSSNNESLTPKAVKKKSKSKTKKSAESETNRKTEEAIQAIKQRLSDYMPSSPEGRDSCSSPRRSRCRPKRAARPANLKDSSLKKKMRRA